MGATNKAPVLAVALAVAALAAVVLLHTRGGVPPGSLDAETYVARLGVGLNVDWLSFPRVERLYFEWRSRGVSIPALVKALGFDHVRIRVEGDVVANRTLLTLLKTVVDDSLKAGLMVVVAYAAPGLRQHPESSAAQQHFLQWWRLVAMELRGEPYTVAYDLIIETSGPIRDHVDVLNKVYSEAIEEIRRIDPQRVVIVTAPHVSKPFWLPRLQLPRDRYLVAEWHIYAKGPCRHGRIEYNETYIAEAVAAATEWSRETGIPTWVGAWRPVCPAPGGHGEILGTWRNYMGFAKAMCSALRRAGIPSALNADLWFINMTTAEPRNDTLPLLQEIMACWRGGLREAG